MAWERHRRGSGPREIGGAGRSDDRGRAAGETAAVEQVHLGSEGVGACRQRYRGQADRRGRGPGAVTYEYV